MPVTQANSLSISYAPMLPQVQPGSIGEGGDKRLGGMKAEEGSGGIQRAFTPKTTWERFTSRLKHGFQGAKFDSDKGATQAATRFNTRHKEFSGKVESLVGRLASGKNSDVSDPDMMATLRNDVKVMHRNAPWASRTDLLSTRMDVELGKLSDKELTEVSKQLASADTSRLTDKDKVDLQTMQRAVLRQQLARSPEMGTMLGTINHAAPSDVSARTTLLTQLKGLETQVGQGLDGLHVPHKGKNEDILSGAMTIALQRAGHTPTEIGGMNRNLLNVERQVCLDKRADKGGGEVPEIASFQPRLRMLGRAVREEYLQTNVTTFKDDNLRSRMKPIGSGAAHTVSKGEYQSGAKDVSRVHKYDDEQLVHPDGGRFGAPAKLGIDQSNPKLLERAVVTSKLDARLGFNVSVGTDFAHHQGQTGIVMELAKGETAKDTVGVKGNPGVAQKEMMKLQLLDIITAQADRHHGNYMVEKNDAGEVTGVKAIDSDFCMGPEPDDAADIVGRHGVHLPGMPPVIDSDMAKAIRGLSDDDLAGLCGDMFDDETLAAAKNRLANLKTHINTLESQGRIISPDDWGKPEVTKRLTETTVGVQDRHGKIKQEPTSYWQRDYPSMEREFDPMAGFGTW
ncbi:MAG: hypothetical protein V4662_15250 [Verrucomicrobiota bacterium]